jgi:hypothetical protein
LCADARADEWRPIRFGEEFWAMRQTECSLAGGETRVAN